ncbi:MAG: precorrin-2 C(20)-methyltransferase [Mobilicoccus sp.]|nr:precorrin-2 C(20)-methyltransferase [Mobilicoccus sp.]
MQRRLVGVGMGPGDPDLVTCKAVGLLRAADVVLVGSDDELGLTEVVVREHLDDPRTIRRVGLVDGDLDPAAAAHLAVTAFEAGVGLVVVATLGDPSIYSSFRGLAERVGARVDVTVEVVPGITAMQAFAATSRVPLVEGTESLTLVPAEAGLASFTDALEHSDTVVAYEGGRYIAAMQGELSRRGRLTGAMLGVDVSLDTERITPLVDRPAGPDRPDMTTVVVPAVRDDAP